MIITSDDNPCISEVKEFLGIEVLTFNNEISLSQVTYATVLLSTAGIISQSNGTLFSKATHYLTLVGSLIYLTFTLSDIAYVVHIVSQFMVAPCSTHYFVVLRIVRYVIIKSYADVDWGRDPFDRHSTTSYYIFLGYSLIFW
uniref:Uncharacterized protein n=1 Tax=Solanum lycopersicum TaxID=4081 RepID=A0A3Q7HN67_SOLLC